MDREVIFLMRRGRFLKHQISLLKKGKNPYVNYAQSLAWYTNAIEYNQKLLLEHAPKDLSFLEL